jgi:spore germination protein GerM
MEINFATGFIRDPSSQFSLVVNQLTLYSLASFSRVFSNNHATTMVLVQLSLSLTFTLQELLQIMVVVIHVESSTRSTHDPL